MQPGYKPKTAQTYPLFDTKYQKVELISKDDLEAKFKELSQFIASHLAGLEKIGKYNLNSFTLTIALRAGVLVLSAEGGIELTYKVPQNAGSTGGQ